ncbi:FHA domain-containing protein [Streptomyces sp. P1-3]|uniref:FHA domain-containing protein n=1 Tax=Streptomyces sp. P1-3 TaxID=3421658 RepID=UPI003D35EEDD
MATCPNGHQSAADDWCEVCGHRMSGTPMPPGAPPPPPPMMGAPPPGGPGVPGAPPGGYGYPAPQPKHAFQAELCPQCRTPREAQTPFCEECRYNFLTHSATPYSPPPPPAPGGFQPPSLTPQQPQGTQGGGFPGAGPAHMNHPAEPFAASPAAGTPLPGQLPGQIPGQTPGQAPAAAGVPGHAPGQAPGQGFGSDDDWTLPPPGGPAPTAPPAGAQAPFAPPAHPAPGPGAPGLGAPGPGPGPMPYPPQAPVGPPFGNDDFPSTAVPHPQPVQPAQYPAGPAPAPAGWVAVIAPDREYFMAMMHRSGPEAAGLNLPAYSPEQQLPLTGHQVTIGRRRHSTGESPDIDLSRPPEDPGVSHQHAVLVQQPDGTWAVVDQNSTNGTTINGSEEPIQPYVPVPLQDGDRVHVGAWTTITVRRG